jgi:hypothetical protein
MSDESKKGVVICSMVLPVSPSNQQTVVNLQPENAQWASD